MKVSKITFLLILVVSHVKAQYPFEKYNSINYRQFNNWIKYDWTEKRNRFHQTLSIQEFYNNHDSLTIQLSSFTDDYDSSYIRIYRNKQLELQIFEPMAFTGYNLWGPLLVADVNGDSLQDIKLNVAYLGNGLASMNTRIIYLFQTKDEKFIKVSFTDKLEHGNRVERDFNHDGNFEIITMTLNGYEGHNYWTFDLFNYENGKLVNVDDKFDYPIMVQYLLKPNYKITDKLTGSKMKEFKLTEPKDIDIK